MSCCEPAIDSDVGPTRTSTPSALMSFCAAVKPASTVPSVSPCSRRISAPLMPPLSLISSAIIWATGCTLAPTQSYWPVKGSNNPTGSVLCARAKPPTMAIKGISKRFIGFLPETGFGFRNRVAPVGAGPPRVMSRRPLRPMPAHSLQHLHQPRRHRLRVPGVPGSLDLFVAAVGGRCGDARGGLAHAGERLGAHDGEDRHREVAQ